MQSYHSGQLSIATSKNPSVVNTICIDSFHYNVITCARLRLKTNVATDEGNVATNEGKD